MRIAMVELPDEITAITLEIMHALPAWFSPPGDIDRKAIIHRDYPFFAAYNGDEPFGFIALKIPNPYTAEVFNMGILEAYHRQGVGSKLMQVVERYCKDNGYLYLTVKTLDEYVRRGRIGFAKISSFSGKP